jgi:hypothetical protein
MLGNASKTFNVTFNHQLWDDDPKPIEDAKKIIEEKAHKIHK